MSRRSPIRGASLGAHCMLESPIMAGPSFDITCPLCGHRFKESTKRLLDNLSVNCSGDTDVKFNGEQGLDTTTEVGSSQVRQRRIVTGLLIGMNIIR